MLLNNIHFISLLPLSIYLWIPLLFCSSTVSQIGRKLLSLEMESDVIYGDSDSYQYYFANFSFGTPPQRITLIIDTGSALMGLPCAGCRHCGAHHLNPFFNLTRKSNKFMFI